MAATAAEAMGKIRAAGGRHDAVVLDAGLPDKRGATPRGELRALHVDLPVLMTSGRSERLLDGEFAEDHCTGALAKPYDADQMLSALRSVGVRCAAR